MPKFSQQFGIEVLCAANLKKTLEPQGFNFPHGSDIAMRFVQGGLHYIYPHNFSRRFDHETLRERLLVKALVTRPRTDARFDSAESSC